MILDPTPPAGWGNTRCPVLRQPAGPPLPPAVLLGGPGGYSSVPGRAAGRPCLAPRRHGRGGGPWPSLARLAAQVGETRQPPLSGQAVDGGQEPLEPGERLFALQPDQLGGTL